MSFAEKSLGCIDCKKVFTFSVEEQEFRSYRGFPNEPVRCAPCRIARKNHSPLIESATRSTAQSNKYFR
jgi:hypothetical protein